jgi:CheY-like chemotaxis protein
MFRQDPNEFDLVITDQVMPEMTGREVAEKLGAARPTLYLREPGEPWRPIVLDADAAGRSTYRLRDIRATLHLFASAGGAVSDTLTVRVLEPAFLTDFAVTASYPAYLAREDETLPTDAGPLTLPVGTVLLLRAVASAPLGRAALVAGGERFALETEGSGASGRLVVRGSAAWHLALADRAGLEVPEPLPTLEVRAVPDSAPVVTVPVPGVDTTAALDLRQGIVVVARDDHGLARVELVSWRVSRNGLVGTPVVDTLAGAEGADRVVIQTVLDLTGRVALVSGAARNMGRSAAIALAESGADLLIADIDEPEPLAPVELGLDLIDGQFTDVLLDFLHQLQETGRMHAHVTVLPATVRSPADPAVHRAAVGSSSPASRCWPRSPPRNSAAR